MQAKAPQSARSLYSPKCLALGIKYLQCLVKTQADAVDNNNALASSIELTLKRFFMAERFPSALAEKGSSRLFRWPRKDDIAMNYHFQIALSISIS